MRTPGPFKVNRCGWLFSQLTKTFRLQEEFSGKAMCCHNSKCYMVTKNVTKNTAERCSKLLEARTGRPHPIDYSCCEETSGAAKFSAKGTNRNQNKETLTFDRYLQVLEGQEAVMGKNSGFTCIQGQMYKYSVDKVSLQYFYCKRRVAADYSTLPLV